MSEAFQTASSQRRRLLTPSLTHIGPPRSQPFHTCLADWGSVNCRAGSCEAPETFLTMLSSAFGALSLADKSWPCHRSKMNRLCHDPREAPRLSMD
jgi:hypothetical protein